MSAYAAYVVSAYMVAGGTILALVGWAVIERKRARRALDRAERAARRVGAGVERVR